MPFSKNQLIILGIGGLILLFFVLAFSGFLPGSRQSEPKAELKLWGVGDAPSVWGATISSFRSLFPQISVNYTRVDESDYERKLIDALAAGEGPDILMFHNTWFSKHGNKIVPAGADQIDITSFRKIYPDVAESDFVSENQIFALPLSVDTLGLFYNKDIFNNKKIAVPPATWDDFKSTILKVREFDSGGISKSGAAIGGTGKSIVNATDILNLVMLQFKTPMIDDFSGRAALNNQNGRAALNFYTQFVSPQSSYYTWEDSFANSVDSFAQGKAAMIFAYASQAPLIKGKNPFLNFGVSPAPQFTRDQSINFASYWGLAVSAKTRYLKEAWDFVVFAGTNGEAAKNYVALTSKPPALRALIQSHLQDSFLGTFAGQALTAKSWRQSDNTVVKSAFDNMIESVLTGRFRADQALEQAETEINNVRR
ncbi:MAG: extracellular solute-binding protein [Candidatus Colwellbacteria bacterium]|nr:extracellular solute-binding protein [Candidatus Colwellbacteria bacterium]